MTEIEIGNKEIDRHLGEIRENRQGEETAACSDGARGLSELP